MGTCVVIGFHHRLLAMSFAKFVVISMITQHSAGLNELPKAKHRYISICTMDTQIRFPAKYVFTCMRLHTVSKFSLHTRIGMKRWAYCIMCTICSHQRIMKP